MLNSWKSLRYDDIGDFDIMYKYNSSEISYHELSV